MTDLTTPEGRLSAVEQFGPTEYSRLMREHHVKSIVAHIAGHEIRRVPTGFGLLYAVGDTGKAFATFQLAAIHARSAPV